MSRWGGGPSGWRQLEEIICDFVETIIDRPERSVFVKLSAKDYELIDKILKGNDLERVVIILLLLLKKRINLSLSLCRLTLRKR